MNMKELASKWGWNLQADKKNIYVAKTPQMYVSLMKSQVVFFALRSIMDIRHAIDQKNILLKIQPPHGYVVEYPMAEAGKASGVCLKIKIPNKDWSAHNDEVKNIAENLVRVLQENDIWTGKLEDGHEYGKSCEKGDVKKGEKSLPKGCAITHNDPFEGHAENGPGHPGKGFSAGRSVLSSPRASYARRPGRRTLPREGPGPWPSCAHGIPEGK